MSLYNKIVILAVAFCLTGCKPPKFDQDINCPTFNATGVAVYEYSDPGLLAVLYPDYSLVKLDKTGCVIRAKAKR